MTVCAAVAWLSLTRPDLCCGINRAAHVTLKTYSRRHMRDVNKAMKRAKDSSYCGFLYHPLRSGSVRLKVHADASFASNDDGSSQLGHLILLRHERGTFQVLP